MEKGVSVSTSSKDALSLNFSVQSVRHASPKRYKPGSLSLISAGIYFIKEYPDQLLDIAASSLVLGDAFLTATENIKSTPVEVVLTVYAVQNGNYIIHNTYAYYIDQIDENLFESAGRPRLIPVTGSAK